MLQKNTYSPFRKLKLSCIHALSFTSVVISILLIATTYVYSSQITLTWSQNTESDLAGYKIHSGPSSRNYDNITNVGNLTNYTAQDLVEGQTYYFALTA